MKRSPLPSETLSLASLAFTVLILTGVILWHDNALQTTTLSRTAQPNVIARRFLADADDGHKDAPTLDDDQNRTTTCKKYLYNFLNGTTDSNDQCNAFYSAYKAADCEHDTHVVILDEDDKNKTDKEDDLLIDDFFENWECCDSIQQFYERNCEQTSELHSSRLLGIMLVMLACTMIKALLKAFGVNWLPDACAFILVGTIVGALVRVVNKGLLQNRQSFDNDLFLQILLPPIIFQAALSIDKRAFRRDLFPILLFAGLGTAFSAVAIGLITHHVSTLGSEDTLPLLDSLVFGSLISSIDPVATLSILAGVGVSQTDTLYTLIFGESLLNDGVAIVLFETLVDHLGEDEELGKEAYQEMAKHFFVVLFGSIAIGLAIGACCTVYFYVLRGRQTAVTEVGVFFCWALIPYYVADGLSCSGIIAIMVMGFLMDYYVIGGSHPQQNPTVNDYMPMQNFGNGEERAMPFGGGDRWTDLQIFFSQAFNGDGHILSRSRTHVGFVAHVVASIMDTAIFAYLGLFLFSDNKWDFRLNLTAILGVVSSRGVMVGILSLLINIFVFFDVENKLKRFYRSFRRVNLADDDDFTEGHNKPYLDKKTQLILLLAGVRGAVSFSLVESIPVWDQVTKTGSKYKAELKAMTSSSIVFTLFVFGALTYVAVKRGDEGERIQGRGLGHRLIPNDDDEDELDAVNASLEMDHNFVTPTVEEEQMQYPPRPQWME
ncbi:unnamed protein product [Cylindrotheca closterium]|uniref:Cation/H+ exchanger transmembrane domain-containing protein n=1 Tax=Cylindrotheca closterium TaxID=2856 RepID=A0AAD2FIJ4_9STRA|nr:unnamed protein product [Cylindrotheca closterium]